MQKPHPPVLVGGNGAKVLDRVIAFGDEWMPNRIGDEERFKSADRRSSRTQGREAGRDPIPVTLALAPSDPAEIEAYAEIGVHRCLCWVPPAARDVVERALDKYTPLVEKLGEIDRRGLPGPARSTQSRCSRSARHSSSLTRLPPCGIALSEASSAAAPRPCTRTDSSSLLAHEPSR